jgi:hypothetical protein
MDFRRHGSGQNTSVQRSITLQEKAGHRPLAAIHLLTGPPQ